MILSKFSQKLKNFLLPPLPPTAQSLATTLGMANTFSWQQKFNGFFHVFPNETLGMKRVNFCNFYQSLLNINIIVDKLTRCHSVINPGLSPWGSARAPYGRGLSPAPQLATALLFYGRLLKGIRMKTQCSHSCYVICCISRSLLTIVIFTVT